jgi:AraC-like DNA-binding protein/ligand-binding sensor protein
MNANKELLETLTNSSTYQDYEKAYNEATGLPLTLRPLETWQLPLHAKRNETPFCAMMAGKSRSCAACLQMQEKLAQCASSEPATLTCSYGLCETGVPVKLGDQTIGILQTGQVMLRRPTAASFNRVVEAAEKQSVTLDQNARELYMKTPVISRKKLDSVTTLLTIFSEFLSMKSNQIAVRKANAEPPVIAKAKQYIDDHYTEELSLGQVAQATHTSIFYFCKLFKKATGMNFTEFVSRTRIEKATNLLLNPNLRVSEIAYEVGFQSLTHFNRVFKKVIGQSPSEYREQLKAA